MHNEFDRGEGVGEAREEVVEEAETESKPKLVLDKGEIWRVIHSMDGEDFAKFALVRGIDFKKPFRLVTDGEEIDQDFNQPEEVRAYLTGKFVNEIN